MQNIDDESRSTLTGKRILAQHEAVLIVPAGDAPALLEAGWVDCLRVSGERHVPAVAASRGRRWPLQRHARLCYLAGQGFTAKMIASDPLVASTPNGVQRQAQRCGIALSGIPAGEVRFRLPAQSLARLERKATEAGLSRDLYLRRWVLAALEEA